MLRNFLKIAFRNLSLRKGFTLINIAGLAIGITCCLLIFEYVAYERSYENFNRNGDRIFRVQDEEYQNGKLVVPCASAMPGVAPAMLREFPEVESAGRLRKVEELIGNEVRNIRFKEPDIYYADEPMVNILQLSFEEGDGKAVLSAPDKVIISAAEKKKYFGSEPALGKVLTMHSNGQARSLQVTGVFKDYPDNSHLKLSILISYLTYSKVIGSYGRRDDVLETSFGWTDFYTYILLRKGVSSKQVADKLPAFMNRHYNDLPENKNRGDRYELSLMPLKNIHLYSHYTEEAEANGDGRAVNILFLVAFFIIGIAWINYINLATARSLERAREVGLRKVLGALKRELIGQFMLESLMLNIMALLLACVVTFAVNPLFASLTGKPLPSLIALPLNFQLYFIGLLAAGTFLSGIYPAMVLSRYQPVTVLKGLFKNTAGGQWLRKGLIVGQFAISIILIAGTMIVYRQLHYMQNQEPGANINETLVIKGAEGSITDSAYNNVYGSFKEEMLAINGVKSMTGSSGIMGEEILWSTNWERLQGGISQANNLFHLGVDADFIDNYDIKMVAGEPFSHVLGADKKKVILNETAVRTLGFPSPKAAIGQLISGGQNNMDSLAVKGVIADYHNEGLQVSIQPLVLFADRRTRAFYSIKMQGKNAVATVASIKKIWDRFFPGEPFDYFFLDEFFNRQYAENKRFGQVFGLFAILAIGIACFGLLGLSAYNVLQRTKEIGVRKVLGASVNSLVLALSKDFLKLIAFAFIIAIPITMLAMQSWLQDFAYRTSIPWWLYVLAGLLALLIALVTVGYQSLRAALANPINSLRTE